MATTDQQVLSEIQYQLSEPVDGGATWPSQLWTTEEVVEYLKQRQQRFLLETGLVLSENSASPIAAAADTRRFAYPTDWIVTVRAAWRVEGGTFQEIARGDMWEADQGTPTWTNTSASVPSLWTDGDVPTLTIQLAPPSSSAGEIELVYVAIPTAPTGLGVSLVVPDEWAVCLKYGVMADMLSKLGRGNDPARAQWAEQFYQEGVLSAKLMMAGWLSPMPQGRSRRR